MDENTDKENSVSLYELCDSRLDNNSKRENSARKESTTKDRRGVGGNTLETGNLIKEEDFEDMTDRNGI